MLTEKVAASGDDLINIGIGDIKMGDHAELAIAANQDTSLLQIIDQPRPQRRIARGKNHVALAG